LPAFGVYVVRDAVTPSAVAARRGFNREQAMLPEYGLNGKVALVTGAGRGLGEQIALALAEAGADVALAGRDLSRLTSVAAAVEALGRRHVTAQVDVQNEAQVARMVAETHAALGRIDILVSNAGIFKRMPTAELSLDRWSEELRTNLTGPFLCMKAVQPLMAAQGGGVMINIASVAGIVGRANLAAYCASKAGVIGLTRALAMEWAPLGIRVNAIAPGQFDTEMGAPLMNDPDALREFLKSVPLRRVGRPREIGVLAVTLAADASAFMTGQVVVVDGGATAH
jgi:NAD(P)-dependent dehydrogenase (short-subunit alcohol dehydrogenase family)